MEQPTNTPKFGSRLATAKRVALLVAVGAATIGLTVAQQPIAGVILVAAALLVDMLATANRGTECELAQVEFLCEHWRFMAEYNRERAEQAEARLEAVRAELIARCADAECDQ